MNPNRADSSIVDALLDLEAGMNAAHRDGPFRDPAFANIEHPYNVNIGKVNAGDWASIVSSVARLEVRIGRPIVETL